MNREKMNSVNGDLVELEKLLLERRFGPALKKSISMLQNQSQLIPPSHEILPLVTPITFTCMGPEVNALQLQLELQGTDSSLDRIGAIALQSWYEIWRAKDKQQSEKGTQFLTQILENFCTSSDGSTSTEKSALCMGFTLCLMLLNLLLSTGNQWDAIALGGELMHISLRNKEKIVEKHRQELAGVLLTRLLPSLASVSVANDFVWRVQQKEWTPLSSSLATSLHPKTETIDFLIDFLKTPDSDGWSLSHAVKESCLASLQRTQSSLCCGRVPEQPLATAFVPETTKVGFSSNHQTVEKSFLVPFVRACIRLQKLVKQAVTSGTRQEKGMLTLMAASLFAAIRQRVLLWKISQKTLQLITLPIREVIQALIPPSHTN